MELRTKTVLAAVLIYSFASPLSKADSKTLAEHLGYKATDKLLIINGDDTGMCHAANTATIDSLERGLMTSATIMVPCPWFTEIARYAKANPGKDFGVHLCHTSEWQVYRWGPVAPREKVPGLVDNEGYLWRSVPEVYQHATPEEALTEARAQVHKALDAGIDVTHLDTHMGALNFDKDGTVFVDPTNLPNFLISKLSESGEVLLDENNDVFILDDAFVNVLATNHVFTRLGRIDSLTANKTILENLKKQATPVPRRDQVTYAKASFISGN